MATAPENNPMITSFVKAAPIKCAEGGMAMTKVTRDALMRLGRKVNLQPPRTATPAPWYRQFVKR
jgi:hypothetical protein